MAWKLASLFVDISGQDRGLKGTLAGVRNSLLGFGPAAAKAGGQGLSSLNVAAGMLLGGLATTAVSAGARMGAGLFQSVLLGASDLNETMSKVGVVFGSSAADVGAAADEMAARFGTPKTQFLDSAAAIGLIGKAAGQTQAQAASLGTDFARLAGDVSSFYNVPIEEALAAIRSGLVGESEPLRRFGVLLSEEAVQLQAAKMGLAAYGAKLTEAQKVQARAALISRGLGDAQGDLARTIDSPANALRRLTGMVGNAASEIGTALMPAFQALLSIGTEVLSGLSGYLNSNRETIAGWGDTLRGAFDTVGVAWRNFGDVAQIVGLTFLEKILNIGELFAWLPGAAGAVLSWFADNWPEVIADTFNAVWAIVSNVFENIKNLWSAVFNFIMNPSEGFHFDFTPLLDGFEATVKELPAIAAPELTSLQDQINAVTDRMANREVKRAEEKAKAAADAAGGAGSEKTTTAEEGDVGKKPEKATTTDLAGFAQRLQEGVFGKDKVAQDQLKEQQEQTRIQREQLDLARKQAGKGPMPAVAT